MPKKLIVTGNGLDQALGFPTSYYDLKEAMLLEHWCFNQNEKKFCNQFLKKLKLDENEFSNFSFFLRSFMEYKKNIYPEKQIPEKEIWSDLEHSITEFLIINENNSNIEKLKNGYEIFLKIIQSYFIYEVYAKIEKILETNIISKKSVMSFYDLLLTTDSVNITLNYTNFFSYVRKIKGDTMEIKISDKGFMFPHLICMVTPFIYLMENNIVPFNILDINNDIIPKHPDGNIIEDNQQYLQITNEYRTSNPKYITNPESLFQKNIFKGKNPLFIIFGSTNSKIKNNKNLRFLSKNKSLILPLNRIPDQHFLKIDECDIDGVYVMGYSFGEEDELFNEAIYKKICSSKELKILYFKNNNNFDVDKNFEFLKKDIRKKISSFLEEDERMNIDKLVSSINIEKLIIK